MSKRPSWLDPLLSLGILAVAFGISLLLQQVCPSQSLVSMIFVLAVFLISLTTKGYLWGVLASFAGVLIDNYVFAFPMFAFDFITAENFIAAVVLLIVAIITCTLTTRLKEQERIKAETEKEKMRGNLLRAISHDLRTPLTTIYGSSSAIMENYDTLPKQQQLKLLEQVREDSENLIRMVENLLSVTRVNDESVRINKIPTVLEELIDAALLKFSKIYPNHPVDVSIPDEFISIPMDAMLIQQVLMNLLENAVFHAHGMQNLWLTVKIQGTKAVFTISDDGCGIPPERLEDLFTGYLGSSARQGDSSRRNMGIGLSVCATIIKAQGGSISARNRAPRGAEFTFTLNLEE